jgi:hypothetical protein
LLFQGLSFFYWIIGVLGSQSGALRSNTPFRGRRCCTLGLSDTNLTSRVRRRSIRHELFMAVNDLQKLTQYSRGNPGSGVRGNPIKFRLFGRGIDRPDDFGEFSCLNYVVVFAWLVPITKREAGFLRTKVWNPFENILRS